MFDPIERRNSAGDVLNRWQIPDAYGDRVEIENAGAVADFVFDTVDAVEEAIRQLGILRTNMQVARDVAEAARESVSDRQARRFADAVVKGYGARDAGPRLSSDGDRLIDRARA